MPYKVIVSGNIFEVYHYEKEPKNNLDRFDRPDDYDPFDYENTKVDIQDRTHERKTQTIRDARNLTRRLALMNFKNNDKFLTLTFDPKKFNDTALYDLDFVDKEFKKFIQRFNYRFKVKLNYVAVREQHKSGRFHFHMICDWEQEFSCNEQIREFERLLGNEVWKNGFVDIKEINHVDNVGAYIIKYMTKDLSLDLYKNKKLYLCSKGLQRPMVYRGHEADTIMAAYGLEQKKEVFTNSYESEYLGKITYKEYNMIRLYNNKD
ncbi:rolling circle replication-associated protein [Priestia koreensis]|uniref:rolling circle replication-associated protein n=1 Tax=Priestia koreensis TaxID=284581 RepID=UPI003017AD41